MGAAEAVGYDCRRGGDPFVECVQVIEAVVGYLHQILFSIPGELPILLL